jgi:hypothetical protein
MPWSHKEVRVRSRAELQAALRRAERIVVEGDDGLAAYAASVAGGSPREATAPDGARLRPLGAAERAAHVAVGGNGPRLWPWVAGAAGVAAGAAAAVLLEHFARVTATLASAKGAAPRVDALPHAPPDPSLLLWPSVAVALILGLFFVARRMTSADRAVTPAWRIAEADQGRVVIARVHGHAA